MEEWTPLQDRLHPLVGKNKRPLNRVAFMKFRNLIRYFGVELEGAAVPDCGLGADGVLAAGRRAGVVADGAAGALVFGGAGTPETTL